MTAIKQFIEDFLIAEAEAFTLWRKSRDIAVFNAAYYKMHSYTVHALNGGLGLQHLQQPENDDFYGSELLSALRLRNYYKISQYEHPKYETVWVAYTSEKNPPPEVKFFSDAFFIIRENDSYKIGSHSLYSDLDPDLQMRVYEHKWVWLSGLVDLDFESLGKLVRIERYLEPVDFEDNLKMYLEDK